MISYVYIYIYYVYRFPILIQHHGSPLGHQLRSSARRSLWRPRRPADGNWILGRGGCCLCDDQLIGLRENLQETVFFLPSNWSGFPVSIFPSSNSMIWWQIYWVKYDVFKLIIMSELLNVQTFRQIWKTVIECSNQSVIGSIIQTFITGITNVFCWCHCLVR
jgi:hypothetical protein